MRRELCQLRMELKGIYPPVWRKILVPSDMSLRQFHRVLQCVMGWEDRHSYTFESGSEIPLGRPWPDESIGGAFSTIEGPLVYLYDPGDGWEHVITLEERVLSDVDVGPTICLAGERACPPEDCGGIPGYEDVLRAMKRPNAKTNAELIEWVGASFDPLAFSLDEVNRKLGNLSR